MTRSRGSGQRGVSPRKDLQSYLHLMGARPELLLLAQRSLLLPPQDNSKRRPNDQCQADPLECQNPATVMGKV